MLILEVKSHIGQVCVAVGEFSSDVSEFLPTFGRDACVIMYTGVDVLLDWLLRAVPSFQQDSPIRPIGFDDVPYRAGNIDCVCRRLLQVLFN